MTVGVRDRRSWSRRRRRITAGATGGGEEDDGGGDVTGGGGPEGDGGGRSSLERGDLNPGFCSLEFLCCDRERRRGSEGE